MKLSNIKDFIKSASIVHGGKYDYSKSVYHGSQKHTIIICRDHGEFRQYPFNHIRGQGCPTCAGVSRKSTHKFVIEANFVHSNKYDYSKTKYVSAHEKVKISCRNHGDFEQSPAMHLYGNGCPRCSHNFRSDTAEFIKKARNIHNDTYDYSKSIYVHSKVKLMISCRNHGDFEQSPNMHLNGHGCPTCRRSLGEITIENFLKSIGVRFSVHHRFSECRKKRPLVFDFYLFDHGICVECDSFQHEKSNDFFGGRKRFDDSMERDCIKNMFCKDRGILLVRIPHRSGRNIYGDLLELADIILNNKK